MKLELTFETTIKDGMLLIPTICVGWNDGYQLAFGWLIFTVRLETVKKLTKPLKHA